MYEGCSRNLYSLVHSDDLRSTVDRFGRGGYVEISASAGATNPECSGCGGEVNEPTKDASRGFKFDTPLFCPTRAD